MALFGQTGTERQVERQIVRFRAGVGHLEDDIVSVEEPLEVRVGAVSVAVIMRTPRDDFELAAGFLLSEGLIDGPAAIGAVSYCASAEPPNEKNIIDVKMAQGQRFDDEQLRRNFYASSSCGVCGKASIEAITCRVPKLESELVLTPGQLCALPEKMRAAQAVFAQTGSLHAAALFDAMGELLLLREDVGRHNAVDKIVGAYALRGEAMPDNSVLMVSGRTSFEIVQKALAAGIAMVAAVSAPSSLAVDLAVASGMTLVGFLRGKGFNIYAGAERIRGDMPIIESTV